MPGHVKEARNWISLCSWENNIITTITTIIIMITIVTTIIMITWETNIIITITTIIISITRPKPPYGRQGLAGSWARIQSGGYILGRSQRLTSRLQRSAQIG